MSGSPRLAIVLSHPTQYYSPWFRWLRANTAIPFRVFYLWNFGVTEQRDPKFQATFRWDVDLLSGYEHEFVPNHARDPGTHHFSGLDNPELTTRLARWEPGAVLLFGYKWRSHLQVLRWARRSGVPLLFRGDSHFLGRAPRLLTRAALRFLYARFAAFLPVGAANRDYFTTLGVPPEKLFFAPHAVDGAFFDPARHDYEVAVEKLRAHLRLGADTRVVLFAGKLVPEKQARELLAAFLAARIPDTALVFVGDGPEKHALWAEARAAHREAAVHFLPFANQTEMPARYLLADVFALPSRGLYETWGLAVNEAMHMGVPALVSDRVGCQRDLVTENETGWVFAADDRTALATKLTVALNTVRDPGERARLRQNVRTRVADYSYERAADGLHRAIAHVTSGR